MSNSFSFLGAVLYNTKITLHYIFIVAFYCLENFKDHCDMADDVRILSEVTSLKCQHRMTQSNESFQCEVFVSINRLHPALKDKAQSQCAHNTGISRGNKHHRQQSAVFVAIILDVTQQ